MYRITGDEGDAVGWFVDVFGPLGRMGRRETRKVIHGRRFFCLGKSVKVCVCVEEDNELDERETSVKHLTFARLFSLCFLFL